MNVLQICLMLNGFQKKTEAEIVKLEDKIRKTKEQMDKIVPLYESQREKEERAATQ